MWTFLRRQGLYFLVGFVIAFVMYLFWRESVRFVMIGVAISAATGVALSIGLFLLERKFEEKEVHHTPPQPLE